MVNLHPHSSCFHLFSPELPLYHPVTLTGSMAPPIKVGIIGYGFSAKCFHLPFVLPNPDLQVYAFFQRAAAPAAGSPPPARGHCTVDFPWAKHYRTADEFFSDPEIDLVIICSGNHEEFAERSLTAGKHGMHPSPIAAVAMSDFCSHSHSCRGESLHYLQCCSGQAHRPGQGQGQAAHCLPKYALRIIPCGGGDRAFADHSVSQIGGWTATSAHCVTW